MKELSKVDILDGAKYFLRVSEMLKFNKFTKRDLCSLTGDSYSSEIVSSILKFLFDFQFITRIDKERSPYIYYLDKTKLAIFLRDSKFFNNQFTLIVKNSIFGGVYRF
jgi:hypothetical protein